jgi:hypothetical protein
MLARETHEDFNLILTRYALERLLYRIGQSRYSDQFELKGAMLFLAWMSETHKPTRDLDLKSVRGRRRHGIFSSFCRLLLGEQLPTARGEKPNLLVDRSQTR